MFNVIDCKTLCFFLQSAIDTREWTCRKRKASTVATTMASVSSAPSVIVASKYYTANSSDFFVNIYALWLQEKSTETYKVFSCIYQ